METYRFGIVWFEVMKACIPTVLPDHVLLGYVQRKSLAFGNVGYIGGKWQAGISRLEKTKAKAKAIVEK